MQLERGGSKRADADLAVKARSVWWSGVTYVHTHTHTCIICTPYIEETRPNDKKLLTENKQVGETVVDGQKCSRA